MLLTARHRRRRLLVLLTAQSFCQPKISMRRRSLRLRLSPRGWLL